MTSHGLEGRLGTVQWISAPKPGQGYFQGRTLELPTTWIDNLSWPLGGVCFVPSGVWAFWSSEAHHSTQWLQDNAQTQLFFLTVFLLTPKPPTLPAHTTPRRPHIFEIEVKGLEIQSIRKRKMRFAPWNTMNQSPPTSIITTKSKQAISL